MQAARADLTKLRERHAKLTTTVTAELSHLHTLIPAAASATNGSGSGSGVAQAAALLAAASKRTADTAASALDVSDVAAGDLASASSSADSSAGGGALADVSLSEKKNAICTDDEFVCRPIGKLRTCFVEKNGTPRQGCVCPSSAATLKLRLAAGLNGAHSLEGLDAFSHVWLLFVFHLNGNVAAKSKVTPPRGDGLKTGLFGTRTPHRPNPIGLSLVRLESIKGDTLHLSGIDLVDGTPILDVKPYVPFADGNLLEKPTVAHWLSHRPTPDLDVEFTPSAEAQLQALAPSLRLLKDVAQARAALSEILAGDPRSVHWRQQRQDVEYGFSIDCLNVVVTFAGGRAIVNQVQHLDLCDRSHAANRAAPT